MFLSKVSPSQVYSDTGPTAKAATEAANAPMTKAELQEELKREQQMRTLNGQDNIETD